MGDFTKLSKAVQTQFDEMAEETLYKVNVDSDLLYQTYLNAFPQGTNEIFRERTEHDCSCCRNFIKNLGKVVMIQEDELVTVWDVHVTEYPYDIVAKKMSEFIKAQKIQNVFLTKERKYGNEFNLELMEDETTRRWDHFVGHVPSQHRRASPATDIGTFQTSFKVFKRGLEELTLDALDSVIDLIESKSIYRGEEHLEAVKKFRAVKATYGGEDDLFIWRNVKNVSLCRFKNSVIGTLISDLSSGVDLQDAVKMFESKVAPANYKRPKALITPKMIASAMEKISDLGLEPALNRRYAKFSDVSVNDVLFVDNSVQSQLIDGLEAELLKTVKTKAVNVKNAQEITIEDFMSSVVPKAIEIEALVKNRDTKNLASLTAPVSEDVGQLFKWNNNFAWSYDGNIADSDLKKRVKSAGGDVDALFRVSLGWFNFDDLDIHVRTPNGQHIYYGNKAGILDIDMNAGGRNSREAVENTRWNHNNLHDGKYVFSVNNYTKRESVNVGFDLELDFAGDVRKYHFPKTVGENKTIQCLEVVIKDKTLESVKVLNESITSETTSQEKWGVNTENFVKVTSLVLSPNHWGDNEAGNKHWFFILDGCKNPDKTRGIYNEFLSPKLEEHRKVFEIIGEKTKCDYSDEQLSGLGFSSTKKESLTVKVKSEKMQQTYNITF